MNEFDQFVKHELKIKHYARYTDDFVIVSTDPKELANLLPCISDFLREYLKLELHPNKVEIRRYSQGIDFLGYIEFPHFRLMRKKSKKRMFRKITHATTKYKLGTFDKNRVEATLHSYLGILTHADAYRLGEKLKNDFWMQMSSNKYL
jgi:RNA-directed DNA polymerase